MQPDILIVELALAMDNDQLLDKMRVMKKARECRDIRHIACVFSGFADDPRELWEIPAVRALCRRLVSGGFISYLDFSTVYPPGAAPEPLGGTLGALEVWACAEGKWLADRILAIDAALLAAARDAYQASNTAADAAVGPFEAKL